MNKFLKQVQDDENKLIIKTRQAEFSSTSHQIKTKNLFLKRI